METYKDKAELLLQNLMGLKENCLMTDCEKETVNFCFRLVKFSSDSLTIKLVSKDEYEKITAYIIKEVDFPNFIFHKDVYDDTCMYLVCNPCT